MSEIGFTGDKATACAARFGLTKLWVQLMRSWVCSVYLTLQHFVLGKLAVAAQAVRPLCTLVRLAYDETGEKLNLAVDGLSAGQNTSVWQVLVARLEVIVVLGRLRTFRHTCVPPSPLVPTPNAENI